MRKNLCAMQGDLRNVGSPLGQEDPAEECMKTHSSMLAWRIPWTEEPGGLQSTGFQRVKTQLRRCSTHAHTQEQLNFIYMGHALPDCFRSNIFSSNITVIIIIMLYTINIII